MVMKNDGRERKRKIEKVICPICGFKTELIEENIEHIEEIRYIMCDHCGNDIILKR